jgi:hypothetical protein
MVVIGLNDIPIWSSTSTSGNLESRKFRYLSNDMGKFYILNCCDLLTGLFCDILITEGNVFNHLEVERVTNSPRRFSLKRVLIPEIEGYVISINNDYNWIALQ